VPAPELEALRDLVRAREDLLRHGLLWAGPGETWGRRHVEWLSKIRFGQPLLEVVFGEYLAYHEVLFARRDRLDTLILEQSTQGPVGTGRRSFALPARRGYVDGGRPGR
jgi:hypothetical protein